MEIKVGDKFSRLSYGEVTDVNGLDVTVKNEDGVQWMIAKNLVEEQFSMAASVESTEEKLTQTAITAKVLSNPGTVMTVSFNKKVKEADVVRMITVAPANTTSKAKILAREILKGEERIMIGRHYHSIDDNGQLSFIDMELEKEIKTSADGNTYDVRMRKLDPRTINWVIVDNVKYIKK